MEPTYTVRGADGREYGPVSLTQVATWTRDGRLQAHSEVRRNDMQHWAPAGDFTELKEYFAPATPAASLAPAPFPGSPTMGSAAEVNPQTVAQMKSGSSWFYWIAGLSLINSIIAFTGSDWRFLFGLGITQVFDAIGQGIGNAGHAVALVLDLAVAGLFVFLGVFAGKGHLWAFIVGMVLFGLDGLLMVLATDWLGVAFHALVLYWLFRGLKACRELKAQ